MSKALIETICLLVSGVVLLVALAAGGIDWTDVSPQNQCGFDPADIDFVHLYPPPDEALQ